MEIPSDNTPSLLSGGRGRLRERDTASPLSFCSLCPRPPPPPLQDSKSCFCPGEKKGGSPSKMEENRSGKHFPAHSCPFGQRDCRFSLRIPSPCGVGGGLFSRLLPGPPPPPAESIGGSRRRRTLPNCPLLLLHADPPPLFVSSSSSSFPPPLHDVPHSYSKPGPLLPLPSPPFFGPLCRDAEDGGEGRGHLPARRRRRRSVLALLQSVTGFGRATRQSSSSSPLPPPLEECSSSSQAEDVFSHKPGREKKETRRG